MNTLIRAWLLAPTSQRHLAYAAASVAVAVSVFYGALDGSYGLHVLWTPAPVAMAVGWFVPRFAPWSLSVAAVIVAALNSNEAVYFGWAVGALVFLAVLEDPAKRPMIGWLAGVTGGVLSLLLTPGMNVAPFVATAIGYLCAAPLRYRMRNAALTAETEALRGQATWLEQRTVLARELHDVVGHHVTAMVVQAEAGQVGDPEAALRAIAEAGRGALSELDALVIHLRDPDATMMLSAPPRLDDIDELLAQPLRAQGVQVEVFVDAESGLDDVGVLTAYRIVQEALTNVTKHAQATAAWVEVRRAGERVRVRISDDGTGPPSVIGRGSGLVGIEERASALGGHVDPSTRPGGGVMLDVTLPVRA